MLLIILRILTIVGPILIGLSQIIPASSPFWNNLGTDKEVFLSLLSLYFTVLSATVVLEFHERNKLIGDELERFSSALKNQFTGKRISAHDFYFDFLNEIRKAKTNVNICYFSPQPPDTTEHKDRKEYYRKLVPLIKRSPKVNFRRIIRYTEKNKKWISDQLNIYKNVPNFSMSVIYDMEDSNQKMPYSLSVQVVDNLKCWLVAIETHESDARFRDIYLEGEAVGDALSGYFNRLWNLSDKVMENGVLTAKGQLLQNG